MSSPYTADSWPAYFTTRVVFGSWVAISGQPAVGSVTLTPEPEALYVANNGATVVPDPPIIATLDANGAIRIPVPITDDPDVSPARWTYTVSENFPGGRTYSISVPGGDGSPLNIQDVTPRQSSIGIPTYLGPRGAQGPPGPPTTFVDNGDGTFTEQGSPDFTDNGDGSYSIVSAGSTLTAPLTSYPGLSSSLLAVTSDGSITVDDTDPRRPKLSTTASSAFSTTPDGRPLLDCGNPTQS